MSRFRFKNERQHSHQQRGPIEDLPLKHGHPDLIKRIVVTASEMDMDPLDLIERDILTLRSIALGFSCRSKVSTEREPNPEEIWQDQWYDQMHQASDGEMGELSTEEKILCSVSASLLTLAWVTFNEG